MRPIRSIATALLIASVAVAGCGRSQPDQPDTAASQPSAVTAPPTTKAPATASPTTAAPDNHATSKPPVLTDGRHPVYLTTIDPGRRTITFDLIQWYWGAEAVKEAAKDHKGSEPIDFYIRNVNPRLRTLPVRSDATIIVNTLAASWTGSATKNVPVSLAKLASLRHCDGHGSPFWITVRNDQVIKIAQQYTP